ncbi:hypothetical protein KY290_032541 [Solanum tuberosum]|uniref:Calcineurin-like phosphoesterase domain-containing protein n=1 Tax=Solanum tuberosum TaxID=4113 RepID=A0ABQ7UDL0_SOLTU|nr:PREDICTED: uncharacterized protein LOC102599125 isoform X2 [Solanum tuberosum]KAH0651629.1 hypothetical protein KY284_031541 [Solanum tuberosum]KAH0744548.1 hypothetical protein KY290_032541 [Solanum tuberosum]
MFNGSTLLHAPTQFRGITGPVRHPAPSKLAGGHFPMASSVRIVVVGDVHDDWNLEEDRKALQLLKPDLVLFTGDFGNENVDLVRSIADLEITKAVILGNHDAWNTQKFSGKEKDAVQLQLECLGDEHVGYRRMDLPTLKLSIVGGRPFSCGGRPLFRKQLLKARYGVRDMDGSAERILQAAMGTPEDHSIIFLAHNGPTGLGANVDDICGRDWFIDGGDHGDPDLAQALAKLKEASPYSVPLVIFGHMHKELASGNGLRKMIVVGNDNIIYLNGAIVPRVRPPSLTAESEGTSRAFTIAEISNGRVEKIAETWISVIGDETRLEEEHILFGSPSRGSLHASLL